MNNDYIILSNGSFISENELCHHGIKGMKWGVHRRAERVGTSASSRSNTASTEDNRTRRMKVKKAVKIGAVLAGTALAAYGGYKLSRYIKTKKSSSKIARKILEEKLSATKNVASTRNITKEVTSKHAAVPTTPSPERKSTPMPKFDGYRSSDFESLRKANADLLNRAIDDIMKGL